MRRSGWLLTAVLVVVSSMLMLACGGGGNEEPGTATEPVATGAAQVTSVAETTPEAAQTPQAQGSAGDFADLIGKFEKATFKVTYQVTSSGAAQSVQGTLTWYKKGENLRMDFNSGAEGQGTSATIISGPDQSYFCTQIPGQGAGGTCLQSPGAAGQGVGQIVGGLDEILANPNAEVASGGSREVLGEKLACFVIRSPDVEGETDVCLTKDGAPLASTVTSNGQVVTMEASEFSHDVSDSDLELPYPIGEAAPGAPSEP
jgi:hypothetical protein